ncbi:MAG: hypothetical protein Ct9H90mP24_7760 [Methanobacteriota archaeon]|nr:MAG: hypothetical protein Ct9H90mP24_7760 [Euryarchaeota archaeon]
MLARLIDNSLVLWIGLAWPTGSTGSKPVQVNMGGPHRGDLSAFVVQTTSPPDSIQREPREDARCSSCSTQNRYFRRRLILPGESLTASRSCDRDLWVVGKDGVQGGCHHRFGSIALRAAIACADGGTVPLMIDEFGIGSASGLTR